MVVVVVVVVVAEKSVLVLNENCLKKCARDKPEHDPVEIGAGEGPTRMTFE